MANAPKRPFHTASDADIKRGEVSDVYFARTVQILIHRGDKKRVKAEIYLKSLPEDWRWGILAGVEEAAALLEGVAVDVWAMDEGTVFEPYQPVLRVEGTYVEWAQYETALLGLLCQASGIATKAARCKKAAADRQVISFGARRMHPTLAPMIERNAFVGGCDGVAVTKSAELIDADPTGTIPHALVLNFALDIMEIEGRPMAKRGKWSGAKDVFRRRGALDTVVLPAGQRPPGPDGAWEPLLKPLVTAGRIVRDQPPPRTLREYVLDQLTRVPLDTLRRAGLRKDF